MSLDVISLFTNVLLELVVERINSRWQYIQKVTKISQMEFTIAIQFILTST